MKQIRDVLDWFDELVDEIVNAVKATRETASQAVLRGNDDEARLLMEQANAMEICREHVETIRKEWAAIKKISIPRKYTRKNKNASSNSKIKRGERTPEEDYFIPILSVLEAMGGKGKVKDVISRLYNVMKGQFKPADLLMLPKNKTPRWSNAAQWARNSMVYQGLLKSHSPRGVWEISDKGREHLRKEAKRL